MYTRKTGTIAFRIGDNESSGRGTVQYRSLNPTGAWDRHWPTILKSWSTPDTGTCTQLNSWLHKDNNADRITCSSASASPTKTISLNLITHWEQKRIHSYKDSNGSRRTKQELLNKLLAWKRTQHVQRSENVTSYERDCESATEERKLNANGAAAGAGTRRSILRHLAQYCGTTSVVLTSAVADLPLTSRRTNPK